MLCKKCGSSVPLYTNVCPSCGTKNSTEEQGAKPEINPKDIRKDCIATIIDYALLFAVSIAFACSDGFNARTFGWWFYCIFFWVILAVVIHNPRKKKKRFQLLRFIFAMVLLGCLGLEASGHISYFFISILVLFALNFFIVFNNNRNLTKLRSLIISSIITVAILIFQIVLIIFVPSDNKLLEQNASSSTVSCANFSPQDSAFAVNLIGDIWTGAASITKETHNRFQDLYKQCPELLAKPDWSSQYKLNILYLEDLLNSVKQHQAIISQERKNLSHLLGQEMFEMQNSYIAHAANGDTIYQPDGTFLYYTEQSIEEAIIQTKKSIQIVQSKLDSLYNPNTYIDWDSF